MNTTNNEQLTDVEQKNYRQENSISLLLTSAGLIFLMTFDNWSIKLIAFAVIVFSTIYLLYIQKKFNQNGDFKTSLVFISSSLGMIFVLWITYMAG